MPDRGRRRAAPTVRLRETRSAADPAFLAAYRFLARVFPRSELLPRRDWLAALHEREAGLWTDLNWHVIVAERGRRLLGVATGSYVGSLNVGVIGYVAVSRGQRFRGLGPRLRRRLRAAFERDARQLRGQVLAALVGEVRVDNPWLGRLVRREGAIALDFPYYQPSLRGRRDAVPLVLYYQPLLRPRHSLSAAEVRRLLYTLWRRPYRVGRPLTRAPFREMLRALAGRRRIGQRALPRPAKQVGGEVE